jgi:hypothetical protein
MSSFDVLLNGVAKERGWDMKQTLRFRDFAKTVAEVESNNNPTAKQPGGGPGRGKHQFELGESSDVAVRRYQALKKRLNVDDAMSEADRKILESGNVDFSELSSEAQDALFLANHIQHPKFKVDDLVNRKLPMEDAWVRYHWAGPEQDEPVRREHYKRTLERLSNG